MTMNNSSVLNERLIALIDINIKARPNANAIQVLRSTIFNNTIYPSLHRLNDRPIVRRNSDNRKNQAVAWRILRKKLPYNLAVFCTRNVSCDSLYHAINDFKYECNSNFHTLFAHTPTK